MRQWAWLKACLILAGVFAGCFTFFRITLADAIRPLGSNSLQPTTTATVQASGNKGITINGTASTTQTSPFVLSLGSTLTFDTISSNAAQPITFTPASGVVRMTDAAGANITTFTPGISGINVSVGGTGNFILAAGNTLLTDKVHATTANTTLTIEGDGATGGVQVGSSQAFAATTGFFTTLYGTTGVINTLTCVTLATTTFTATTVTTTNVTTTNLYVDAIRGRTLSIPVVYGGFDIDSSDGVYTTRIQSSSQNTTINAPGVGSVTIDPTDQLVASFATITALVIPVGGSIVDVGTALLADVTATKLVSTNTTVTNLWTNAIGRRAAGALVLSNTTGVNVALDDGSQASTIVPSSNQLTITPPGGASGVLELGDGLTGTFIAGTIDAITAFVCTGNATVSGFLFNTTHRPYTGTSIRNQATTFSIEDMGGSNASTLAATANVLTVDVNGSGVLQLASGDTLAAGAANITTVNVTTLNNATNVTSTNVNATAVTSTDVTTTRLWTNLIPRKTAAVTEIWNALGLQLGLTDGTLPSSFVPSAGKLTLDVDTTGGVFQLATGDIIAGDFANLTTVNVTTLQNATLVSTTNVSADAMSAKTANTTLTFNARGTGGVDFGTTPVKLGTAAGYANATGDLWYRNSAGQLQPLPIGSSGQMLNVSSGLPAWTSSGAGSITVNENTNSYASTATLQLNGVNGLRSTSSGGTVNVSLTCTTLGYANLVVNLATTNTSVTCTADVLALTNSSNDALWLRTVSLTGGLATTWLSAANGGLDTGTAAIDTWYAIFIIAKLDGTSSLLLSTSATAPTMPSGYTFKRRVSWCRSKHATATQPIDFRQIGNVQAYRTTTSNALTSDGCRILSAGTQTAFTQVVASSRIPSTAFIGIYTVAANASGGGATCQVNYRESNQTNESIQAAYQSMNGATNTDVHAMLQATVSTTQCFDYDVAGANQNAYFDVIGYVDNL